MLMGHQAAKEEREKFAEKIAADPRNFIAQPVVQLSQHPSLVEDHFEGRRVDLRPYIVYGQKVIVMPGGLTRVALRKGSLVVNSSQGGRQQGYVGSGRGAGRMTIAHEPVRTQAHLRRLPRSVSAATQAGPADAGAMRIRCIGWRGMSSGRSTWRGCCW